MPSHSMDLWKRDPYRDLNWKLKLVVESTRSSIRIILEPPEAYPRPARRSVILSITKLNLWQHFGASNSEHGFLASKILGAYISDIGYFDYLSEEEEGITYQHTSAQVKLLEFCSKVYTEAKERWDFCETCSLLGHNSTVAHNECDGCGDESVEESRRTAVNVITTMEIGAETTVFRLCTTCQTNAGILLSITSCTNCSQWMSNDIGQFLASAPSMFSLHAVCPPCFSTAETCRTCERQVPEGRLDENDLCHVCVIAEENEGTVRPWNFKPLFVFHPGGKQDTTAFYVGLEVEVSFGSNVDWSKRDQWVEDLPRGLVYCKSDSSVRNGWEVVTHPMQPEWALEHFPFEIFDELRGMGARDTHDSTGTHAHINKSAFSVGHLWKLMQIHYRLPELCQAAGGRASSGYASFSDRSYLKQKKEIIYILKHKEEVLNEYGRNVALNFSNKDTLEIRYMAGGSTQELVRKNLEWVKALIDYSNEITINQIHKGVLDDAGYFLGWIYDRNDQLPNLNKYLQRVLPAIRTMPEGNN